MLGAWAVLVLLLMVGAAVELARLLTSEDEITMRLIVGRMLTGAVTAVFALLVKVRNPDVEDLAVVGLGAAVAAVGYTSLQPLISGAIKAFFRALFKTDSAGSGKSGD